MAHLAEAEADVFNYTGGVIREDQRAQIIHVVVDHSVTLIDKKAFLECESLLSVKLHEGVVEIGHRAFYGCRSLQKINLRGVRIIGVGAFYGCKSLVDVDFGDKLETIGVYAFYGCEYSLNHIKIPSARSIGDGAFYYCRQLSVAEFGEGLEAIGRGTFWGCTSLTRIAIPVKEGLFSDPDRVFDDCDNLTTVEVVGEIHGTIASLHLEKWKKEIVKEIERINLILTHTPLEEKTSTIINWMESASSLITHYKREHSTMITEAKDIVDGVVWEVQDNERNVSRFNEEGEPKNKKRRITPGPEEDGTRGDVWGTKHDITGHVFSYL